MNTPSSRRRFLKQSALLAGVGMSLPRVPSFAQETNYRPVEDVRFTTKGDSLYAFILLWRRHVED